MSFLDTVSRIPIMFVVSLIAVIPVILKFSKHLKKRPVLVSPEASLEEHLKEEKIDVRYETILDLLFGLLIGLTLAIGIFIWGLIGDYRSSSGLFSADIPITSFPPTPTSPFPPAPGQTTANANNAN